MTEATGRTRPKSPFMASLVSMSWKVSRATLVKVEAKATADLKSEAWKVY